VANHVVRRFLSDQTGSIIEDMGGTIMLIVVGFSFILALAPWVVVQQIQFSIADGLSEAAQAGNGYLFPNQAYTAESESQQIFSAQVAGESTSCQNLTYNPPSQGGQYYGVNVTCTTHFLYYNQTHTFHAQTRISIYQGAGQG